MATLTARIFRWQRATLLLVMLLGGAAAVSADEPPLVLLIQPTLSEEATRRAFQPLAQHLGEATGTRVVIATRPNFLAHWETVRRNTGYDLVLDDAHFTDYRVQKFGFQVLAKLPGTTSYSLVVAARTRLRDPLELVGKKVACFGPPSLGASRLSALFPNPARRPAMIEIATTEEGLELLRQAKVSAAMLPTTSIGEQVDRGEISIVSTTEPTPHMALSASPHLNARQRDKIRMTLLRSAATTDGKEALRIAGFERFEKASAATYANQSRILKEYWGY
jgi:ABC-type phosphate/phosphonate transport system substrate-binding protein